MSQPVTFDAIPFTQLFTNDKVRVATMSGRQHLAIRDLIAVVCRKNPNDARKMWRRIPETDKDNLGVYMSEVQFDNGKQWQPVIQFPGAVQLLCMLPGENAKRLRKRAFSVLLAHFAGNKDALVKTWNDALAQAPIRVAFARNRYTSGSAGASQPAEPAPAAPEQQLVVIPAQPAPTQVVLTQPAPAQVVPAQPAVPEQQPAPAAEKPSKPQAEGYVYAFASDAFPGKFKIGRASDIHSRLSTINTSMEDHDFKLVACFPSYNPSKCEADAHRHFSEMRTKREFFKIDRPDLLAYFAEMNNAFILQKPRPSRAQSPASPRQ